MKKLRVLLISPVEKHDVYCGDVIYTNLLLENPPPNIEYINYIDAQKKGLILERKRLRLLPLWWQENKLIFFLDLLPACLIFLLNILRRANLLIANPWKFFYIKGDFDLVHCHVFPIALSGKKPPLIISNAITSPLFLRYVHKTPIVLVWLIKNIEILLCYLFGIQESSLTISKKTPVILFSQRLAQEYKYLPEQNLNIIPIGLPSLKVSQTNKNNIFQLGFIAKDFKVKGGNELLKAYRQLKQVFPNNLQLTIIGSKPKLSKKELNTLAINWYNFISRQELLNNIAPQWNLFVYPTKADGFPLVILEMLGLGIPCIVSDFLAMPEMINNNYAGQVCKVNDYIDLGQKIKKMLNKNTLRKYSQRAKKLFTEKYAQKVTNKQLADCYNNTVKRGINH